MNRTVMEALARRWASCVAEGSGLEALLSEAMEAGERAGILERARMVATRFSCRSVTSDEVVIEGDRMAWRWTLRGLDSEGLEVAIRGVNFQRVIDGRVAAHWTILAQG